MYKETEQTIIYRMTVKQATMKQVTTDGGDSNKQDDHEADCNGSDNYKAGINESDTMDSETNSNAADDNGANNAETQQTQ